MTTSATTGPPSCHAQSDCETVTVRPSDSRQCHATRRHQYAQGKKKVSLACVTRLSAMGRVAQPKKNLCPGLRMYRVNYNTPRFRDLHQQCYKPYEQIKEPESMHISQPCSRERKPRRAGITLVFVAWHSNFPERIPSPLCRMNE